MNTYITHNTNSARQGKQMHISIGANQASTGTVDTAVIVVVVVVMVVLIVNINSSYR